ncbi:unnamed protein product [Adineta ricciae]|uniref:Protein kinase domain-containing protein n=1 Tax=Adineta ricciae TaxID=249248 RepID=A0A813Y8J4_ADIRI|nr:unnamed protein product [Adineta ricciae]
MSRHLQELRKYENNVDVYRDKYLSGKNDRRIYHGHWLKHHVGPCIFIEMINTTGQHEAYFYRQLNNHQNIIQTYGELENVDNLVIYIQEFAPYGNLADSLYEKSLPQTALLEIFLQIASGMSYIASQAIVHGGLTCRNILLCRNDLNQARNNLVKITDFRLARSLHDSTHDATKLPVSKRYCALEILRCNIASNYTEKSDIYSMGVLMWEALSNSEVPYSNIADENAVVRIKLQDVKLERPKNCNDQMWTLMNQCWNDKPDLRPNFNELNACLTTIQPTDIPEIQKSRSIYEPANGFPYELDVHVTKKGLLGGKFRQIFEADWLIDDRRAIVLIGMNDAPTRDELLCYENLRRCQYITETYGFVRNSIGITLLLQERAPHGHLQELLEKKSMVPSTEVLISIFKQITEAMIYMIDNKMIHGDLRCANVLVFQMDSLDLNKNLIKLSNFAFARPDNPDLTYDDALPHAPLEYCAPEILRSVGRRNYSNFSESYSMGILMWQACSQGRLPYQELSMRHIREKKLRGDILPRPFTCDRQIWPIIKTCWLMDPKNRNSFKTIKEKLFKIDLRSSFRFELDVNCTKHDRIHGKYGRTFYNVTAKGYDKSSIVLVELDSDTSEREASFYMELSSFPNIVPTFGLVKNNLGINMLIQERTQYGDIRTLLQTKQFVPSLRILLKIFLQIIDAMIYIVSKDLVHGDLRCANVLMFEMNSSDPQKNVSKLTNFALTCTNDKSFNNTRQTPIPVRYCATEILQKHDTSMYSESADVYSMATLMWQASSQGEIPYGFDTDDAIVRQRRLDGEKLPKIAGCHEGLWKIMEECWSETPEARHSFTVLKQLLQKVEIRDSHTLHKPSDIPSSGNSIASDRQNGHTPNAVPSANKDTQLDYRNSSVKPDPTKASSVNKSSPTTDEPQSFFMCNKCGREVSTQRTAVHAALCQSVKAISTPTSLPSEPGLCARVCSCLPCFNNLQDRSLTYQTT